MTRSMTAAMQAALLRSTNHLVIIVKMETDSLPILVWSGAGDLVFNAETYKGVGEFGSVTRASETLELAASGVQLSLSGIPGSLIASALTDVRQGRNVSIWVGIVKNPVLDNFVNNGFFETGITGWTDLSTPPADITWNSALQRMDMNETAAQEAGATQQLTGLTIGQEYSLYFEIDDIGAVGVDVAVGTTSGGSDIFIAAELKAKRNKILFTPTVTNPWITFGVAGVTSNDTATIGSIVVLENLPVALIDDPVLAFQGQTDSVVINEGRDSSQIVINVENRLLRLEKTNERRYTSEDQERISPGDKGFDYVESIQEKEILWGKP